ncbi:MAG: 1-deoxy-D-xylulose-5-phosphate synthase [Clostridiales bacterium]|nr:1-deoxy-D-xylulose-5-phosphate synthase [Clostridiales bacterium]
MSRLLDSINVPSDIKNLKLPQLEQLAREIRQFLISTISKTGGHLASNLGIVELTLALHYCFDLPKDKIVWDVGHQAYVHKILTGRREAFSTLRQFGGISGFPKPKESEYDCFAAGHSSTSISAALGICCARDLKGENYHVAAVIGDGSMTGGLAYEALNNVGQSNRNLLVILNDNQMSISENVGAMSRHLNDIRTNPRYLEAKEGVHVLLNRVPVVGKKLDRAIERTKDSVKHLLVSGILFEELGFHYIGPVDGHNIEELIEVIKKVERMKGPVLLHVYTCKGKGYKYAEQLPWEYHGVGSFDINTGKVLKSASGPSYSSIFGNVMVELALKKKNLVAISAAMCSGTGLEKFHREFPKRFFDVGIAEQHAVTFAAGLASQGIVPVFAVYSTFLQRAYDQVIHDVCLQRLHVVLAIDRAGIVGADGETHQGIYDIAFLSSMPHMTVMAPQNAEELKNMLIFAIEEFDGPVAIRYPRGEASEIYLDRTAPICYGKAQLTEDGQKIALFSAGDMMDEMKQVYDRLVEDGYQPMLINARFLHPIDEDMVRMAASKCQLIFTAENHVKSGGFGEQVEVFVSDNNLSVKTEIFAFPDAFIEHGNKSQLFLKYAMDSDSIYQKIIARVKEMDEQHG